MDTDEEELVTDDEGEKHPIVGINKYNVKINDNGVKEIVAIHPAFNWGEMTRKFISTITENSPHWINKKFYKEDNGVDDTEVLAFIWKSERYINGKKSSKAIIKLRKEMDNTFHEVLCKKKNFEIKSTIKSFDDAKCHGIVIPDNFRMDEGECLYCGRTRSLIMCLESKCIYGFCDNKIYQRLCGCHKDFGIRVLVITICYPELTFKNLEKLRSTRRDILIMVICEKLQPKCKNYPECENDPDPETKHEHNKRRKKLMFTKDQLKEIDDLVYKLGELSPNSLLINKVSACQNLYD